MNKQTIKLILGCSKQSLVEVCLLALKYVYAFYFLKNISFFKTVSSCRNTWPFVLPYRVEFDNQQDAFLWRSSWEIVVSAHFL